MGITVENINVRVSVDSQEAIQNTEKWKKSMEESKEALQQISPDSDGFRTEINKLISATEAFANNASFKDIRKEFNAAKRARDNFAEGTREYAIAQAQVETLGKRIKELTASQKGLNNVTEKGSGFWKRFGIEGKLSLNSIKTAILSTGIGALIIAFGALITKGAELVTIQREFEKIRGEVQQLLNIEGEELDNVTARIKSVATTFDKEYKDVLIATNAVTKELGGTANENLALIEKAFLAGGDASGELIENIKEYSSQAKAAGLTTDQFLSIIASSTQQGVFSDKGIDTVKEFNLRIKEQTKTTKEALVGAFGKEFTTQLFSNLNKGAITSVDALELVATQIDETTIPANKLQTVIADVFGGPGEDAGIQYIKSLKNVNENVEDLIQTNNTYVQAQENQLAANTKLSEAQQKLSNVFQGSSGSIDLFVTTIKTGAIEIIIDLIETLQPAGAWLLRLFDYLLNGANAAGEFGAGIRATVFAINLAIAPIRLMWNTLVSGVDILLNVGKGFDVLQQKAFQSINNTIDIVNSLLPEFAQIPQVKIEVDDSQLNSLAEKVKAGNVVLEEQTKAANAKSQANIIKENEKTGSEAIKGFVSGLAKEQPKVIEAVEGSIEDLRAKIKAKKDTIDKIVDVEVKARLFEDIEVLENKIDIQEEAIKSIVRPPIEIEQLVTITPTVVSGGSTEIDTPTIATPDEQLASFSQTIDAFANVNEISTETELLNQKIEIFQQEEIAAEEKLRRIAELEEEYANEKFIREQSIVDLQLEINEQLGITDEELIQRKNDLLEQQTEKYTEETEKQIEQAERLKDIEEEFAEKRKEVMVSFVGDLGETFTDFLTDQERDSKEFGKKIILSALDVLQKIITISIAEATAKSFAQADSVASFGASGAIRTAIITALIQGAFAFAKNQITNNFEKGGFVQSGQRLNSFSDVPTVGQYHTEGGINMIDGKTGKVLGQMEKGEPYMILSRDTYKNNKQLINELVHNSQQNNGAKINHEKYFTNNSLDRKEQLFNEIYRINTSNVVNIPINKPDSIIQSISGFPVDQKTVKFLANNILNKKESILKKAISVPSSNLIRTIKIKHEIDKKIKTNDNGNDFRNLEHKIDRLESIILKYPTHLKASFEFQELINMMKTYKETIQEAGG